MPGAGSPPDIRILVVEDDAAIAAELGRQLTGLGYSGVTIAADGEAAALLLQELSPHVVIVDVRLAGQAGVLARIRSHQSVRAILLLSGGGEPRPVIVQEVPVDGCLLLPLSKEQLHSALDPALRPRSPAGGQFRQDSRSILIAEADPAIRGLLSAILEAEGFDVTEACDEDEARRLVLTMRFDLVIVDRPAASPGHPPLAAQLLSIVPAMCILFLSPVSVDSGPPSGTLGNVAFLSKPFAVADLLQTIAGLIRLNR